FFSSRRRHTRFSRDWSSDVCSSDLGGMPGTPLPEGARLWLRGGQLGNQLWLAPAGADSGGGQQGGQLLPAQQLPELLGIQRLAVTEPTQFEQGAGGGGDAADLRITQ